MVVRFLGSLSFLILVMGLFSGCDITIHDTDSNTSDTTNNDSNTSNSDSNSTFSISGNATY